MFIKDLTIRNFRNFKNARFLFTNDSVNTVLGENASGKTNAFYAMRLILDDSLSVNARYLESKDFHRGLGAGHGHWIIISMTFGGLGVTDEEMVMANHAMEMQGDNAEGKYTFIYRPKLHIRDDLFQITNSEPDNEILRVEKINEYLDGIKIGKEDYEVVAYVRTTIDFHINEDNYRTIVGDFVHGIFPDPSTEDALLLGVKKPPYFSLIKEVTCTYVKALRNVVGDMKYSKTNPLYRLLTHKSSEIDGAENIIETVKALNFKISDLPQIKKLSSDIRNTLTTAVGRTYSPALGITSDLPEELKELIQSLALVVEDSNGYIGTGKIEDLSLGGANLIYLALRLYEYEAYQQEEDKIAHFLIIEEPEAHIHNHIQKTLFANFKSENTQVFISTHSTQISSVANVSALNMMSRKDNYSEVYWPSNGLTSKVVVGIERYLNAMRSTLLFAKSVILVEGDAEYILIPVLIKKILGISLDEMGISLVKMDGTVFRHISVLFDLNRIRNYCSILTDLDSSYLDDVTEYANEAYIKKLSDSEVNGALRFDALQEHCKDNVFLEAFFAQNTFETELISAGNSELFISLLPELYSQEARIEKMTKLLNGDNSSQCFYALFLANKESKGWFSIMLCDHVNFETIVPVYILKALLHSLKGHNHETIFKEMMNFRLSCYGNNTEGWPLDDWGKIKIKFSEEFPNDPLAQMFSM